MNKALLVARHEYGRHVFRRSFLLTLLVVPLVVLIGVSVTAIKTRSKPAPPALGLVDEGSLLQSVPPPEGLVLFASEQDARAAWEDGRIAGFAVVPADYPDNPKIGLVSSESPPLATTRSVERLLKERLLAGLPESRATRALAGTQVVVRTPDGRREYSGGVTGGMVLPPIAGLFLLLLIFFGAGDLLDAVVEEKAGRTIEVLATSLSPTRFMFGKVLGIAAATLTLLLLWLAFLAALLVAAALAFGSEWLLDLQPDLMAMALLAGLVIPAYLFVASSLIAAGALLSEARAGRQVTVVLLSIFVGTISMTLPLMESPRSVPAVLLSLLPIFSTVLIPARNLFMEVPAWQVALATGLQLGLALVALRVAGRSLRLGASRFGESLHWRELFGGSAPPDAAVRASEPPPRSVPAPSARSGKPAKVLLVARHEAWTVLSKPVFLGVTLGLPLLLALQMSMFAAVHSEPSTGPPSGGAAAPAFRSAHPRTWGEGTHGYVDPAGLLRSLPEGIPADRLRPFADEESAARALRAGELVAYSLIPPNYIATGRLVVVRPDASPITRGRAAGPLPFALLVNTVGGDEPLAERLRDPVAWRARAVEPATPATATDPADTSVDEVIGMLAMLLLYGVIILASGLLLQSVSDEKKNRTMELLLVSLKPRQLLTGKVLGLGFVGLIQAAIWAGVLAGALALSDRAELFPRGLESPLSMLVWGALLFLFGYAVHAGLVASAGALVPNLKEAQGVSFMMAVPALIGFVAAQFQLNDPHGPIMTGLSMFPLTAPFVMMLRLTTGAVPTWQLVLTLAIMAASSVLIIRATARMFRAQHLLSGERFSLRRYLAALLGRP